MTKFVLQHKGWVVAGWLMLTLAGIFTLKMTPHRVDYSYTTPGQPGYLANLAIEKRLGLDATFESTLPVLRLPEGKSMYTSQGQAMAAHTFAAAVRAGYFGMADYSTTHNSKFILDGGKATWALITIPNPDYNDKVAERIEPALRAAAPSGSSVVVTGFAQMLTPGESNASNQLRTTLIGAFGVFVVLLAVYGSFIAVLPILMAVPAIFVTFLCVLGLTYVTNVSYFILYLITVLSLGVTVDFSLIVLIRWREERERGLSNEDAILASGKSAGGAVMLSGLTAATGLFSLVVLPVPFLRSIGIGAMLIPFVAVALAVTMLPVALSAWGPALDKYCFWPRSSTTISRSWARWARLVVRHRWVAAFAGLVVLIALSTPFLSINTAEPLISSLSRSGHPATTAFKELETNGIPSAVDFPIQILVHGGADGLQQAMTIAAATPGVFAVVSPNARAYRRGKDALMTVIPTAEGSSATGKQIVLSLRRGLTGVPGGVEVGGSTAADMAFTDAVYGNFPLLLTFTSLITFFILTRALRSFVLALKAVVMNLISLGAAFGFMVFFWQQGHGSELIYGVPATGAIRDWIPTVVFACLFGLSMDYEVFVLTRIREEYDRTGSTDDAVIGGIARTGRLVTCAALILTVSLLSMSLNPNQLVRIISTTLAVGIVVDAIIVRTLLVPAIVSLMGRWNWWVPSGLSKFVGVERA